MAVLDILLFLCVALSASTVSQADTFDVTAFGAMGDGNTDDTKAFLEAWEATCKSGGTLIVPGGKIFFLLPVTFMGPCKSSSISVQIDGTLVAPSSQGGWNTECHSNTWIVFESVNGLQVGGTGTLDGKGSVWWNGNNVQDNVTHISDEANEACHKPTTLRLIECDSAYLAGLHFIDSGGNHISIDKCKDLSINKININAPVTSPNTDGIDLFDSSRVSIRDSIISTGDDCIAIKNKCFQVNISDITCGPGHGISVGSLGEHGSEVAVDGVFVQHCTFIKTQASARIKTWEGSSGNGYAKNIFYDHITLDAVKSAIEINQGYSDSPVEPNGAIQISDVHFTNVHGTGDHIRLECSPQAPCENIFVEQLELEPHSREQVEIICKNTKLNTSVVTPNIPC